MIYDLDTLPAWNFYKVFETGDYKYLFDDLVIDDKIDCECVFNEYVDKVNILLGKGVDTDTSFIKLYNKYVILSNIICLLKVRTENTEFIKWLKSNGYKYDESTFERKYESINDLERQLKGLKLKIDLKTPLNIQEHKKQNMYDINVILSKHIGFQIDLKKTPILEYVAIINDFYKK